MPIFIFRTLVLILISHFFACEDNITVKKSPVLSIEPSELFIGLPMEGNYSEGAIELLNSGGVNVIITSLSLNEDDESLELSLLDAEDWSGRVIIEPGVTKTVKIGWRLLDAQPDTGLIAIESNTGSASIRVSTEDPDPELLVEAANESNRDQNTVTITLDEATGKSHQ